MTTTLTVKEHSKLEEEGKEKWYVSVLFCPAKAFATCQFYHRAVGCSPVDIFSCLAKSTLSHLAKGRWGWPQHALTNRSQFHRVWAQQAVPGSGKICSTAHTAQAGTGCLAQGCQELLVPQEGKFVRNTTVYWCLQGSDVSTWNRRHFPPGNTE